MSDGPIRDSFRIQAEWCRKLGSPFTACLCDLFAERLGPGDRFQARILAWPGDPQADNVPLRTAGALNALARSGDAAELATVYPPHAVAPDAWWDAASRAMAAHEDRLSAGLGSPPQTNEIARSGILIGALMQVAAETELPLALFEIGSSAGLNLGLERYAYDLGSRIWGDPASPVTIPCRWEGSPPRLPEELPIAFRAGCDQAPRDPTSAQDRDLLLSYIWPDQEERLARTEAAFALAAASPVRVERADAADWVERMLPQPRPGETRILMHTIVWQYLPDATKARITATMERAGEAATAAAPLAWVAMERDGDRDSAGLRLRIWPGGEERLLARADFHGRWARWI